MTLRRTLVGLAVVAGVSFWAWDQSDDSREWAGTADPVYAAGTADAAGDGNHDDAVHRFRTNQARHWRHVMIGRR